jgi:hypothetical protein
MPLVSRAVRTTTVTLRWMAVAFEGSTDEEIGGSAAI